MFVCIQLSVVFFPTFFFVKTQYNLFCLIYNCNVKCALDFEDGHQPDFKENHNYGLPSTIP